MRRITERGFWASGSRQATGLCWVQLKVRVGLRCLVEDLAPVIVPTSVSPKNAQGAIESAHRYVMQTRLKIAGAWWKVENLEKMLALRVLRANGGWDDYWREVLDEAA